MPKTDSCEIDRMCRIQVRGRKFGYKAGITFLAVKEYKTTETDHRLSFGVPIPDPFTRESVRAVILQRLPPLVDGVKVE